jgi:hypothetical protein
LIERKGRQRLLLAAPVFLVWRGISGTFRTADLWLLAVPFGLRVVSEVLFQSWLARRKGFHFDYERSESSWVEAGEYHPYRYPAEPLNGLGSQ